MYYWMPQRCLQASESPNHVLRAVAEAKDKAAVPEAATAINAAVHDPLLLAVADKFCQIFATKHWPSYKQLCYIGVPLNLTLEPNTI